METVQYIGPRTLLLLLLLLAAFPPRASAYTLRRAPDGQPFRWPGERVELRVDPAITGDLASARGAVAIAADAWRSPWNAPALVVVGETRAQPGHHAFGGENGVYLVRGLWLHGAALAVTVTTASEDTAEILDADVLVSARSDLARVGEDDPAAYDLVALLAHELGHVLGLGESDVVGATMYPRLARGDRAPRTIEADDERGMLAAYEGARRLQYGCATAMGSRSGGALFVLGLALVIVLGARRRAGGKLAIGIGVAILALGFDAPGTIRPAAADPIAIHALFVGEPLRGSIDAVEVVDREGLFFTRCTVETRDGTRVLEVPGGTRDGLVQIVADAPPPAAGDEIVLGAGGAWAFADATHAWGGWLPEHARLPLDTSGLPIEPQSR